MQKRIMALIPFLINHSHAQHLNEPERGRAPGQCDSMLTNAASNGTGGCAQTKCGEQRDQHDRKGLSVNNAINMTGQWMHANTCVQTIHREQHDRRGVRANNGINSRGQGMHANMRANKIPRAKLQKRGTRRSRQGGGQCTQTKCQEQCNRGTRKQHEMQQSNKEHSEWVNKKAE